MNLSKLGTLSVAILIATVSGQALAQKNAQVNFTARLVAATCDVSASKASIDLGTHAIDTIPAVGTPVQEESFNLILNNCTKATADGAPMLLQAAGNTLTGYANYFANANATQAGIKLQSLVDTAAPVTLVPNTSVEVMKAKANQVNFVVPMKAGLYTTDEKISLQPQDINVPVVFSVAYN